MLAVLLNPPAITSGTRTRNAVAHAADVLGHRSSEIVNLCATPTATVVELNAPGTENGWLEARPKISAALRRHDAVLAGWGVAGVYGLSAKLLRDQTDWFVAESEAAGISELWMVGGEPRHPSRWHQYVSDKYGRTAPGPFEDRLREVLTSRPIGGRTSPASLFDANRRR